MKKISLVAAMAAVMGLLPGASAQLRAIDVALRWYWEPNCTSDGDHSTVVVVQGLCQQVPGNPTLPGYKVQCREDGSGEIQYCTDHDCNECPVIQSFASTTCFPNNLNTYGSSSGNVQCPVGIPSNGIVSLPEARLTEGDFEVFWYNNPNCEHGGRQRSIVYGKQTIAHRVPNSQLGHSFKIYCNADRSGVLLMCESWDSSDCQVVFPFEPETCTSSDYSDWGAKSFSVRCPHIGDGEEERIWDPSQYSGSYGTVNRHGSRYISNRREDLGGAPGDMRGGTGRSGTWWFHTPSPRPMRDQPPSEAQVPSGEAPVGGAPGTDPVESFPVAPQGPQSSVFQRRETDVGVTWFERNDCTSTSMFPAGDFTNVIIREEQCQRVPESVDQGYKVRCFVDDFGRRTGSGIFFVCEDIGCGECNVATPFDAGQCVDNPIIYGSASVQFHCIDPEIPQQTPRDGRALAIWYGQEDCDITDRSIVDVVQGFCNVVPKGRMPGYRIVCDDGATTGTFSVCNDVRCEDCPVTSRFATDQCLANPPEFGAQSVSFRCPGSGPFEGLLGEVPVGGAPDFGTGPGANRTVIRSVRPTVRPSPIARRTNDTATRVGTPRPTGRANMTSSVTATATTTRAPAITRTLDSGSRPSGTVSIVALLSLSVAVAMTYVVMD